MSAAAPRSTIARCKSSVSTPPPQPSDHHDPLTALPNRRLLDDRLQQALHLAQRRDKGVALVLVELAAFAGVDEGTLREAARRLGSGLRKADTLARWGAAVRHRAHRRARRAGVPAGG